MNRHKKRISIIVLAVFLLSIVNVPVFAEELGSAMEPMEIAEVTQTGNTTASAAQFRTMEETIATISTEGASGTCGENLIWTLDSEGVLTISGNGEMDNYSSDLKAPWYSYASEIKTIKIEPGVTTIGVAAFKECGKATNLIIPEGITDIGDYAFQNCGGLTNVQLPETVVTIGNWAFDGCSGLMEIALSENISYIGSYVFNGCSSLTNITIPTNVTYINSGLFSGCTGLTKVVLPETIKAIDTYAFCDCSSLADITIPGSVTSIESQAFFNCDSLTSLVIPEGVTSIGSWAFYDCDGLVEVTIPEGIVVIEQISFSSCDKLKNVTIPASVVRIGQSAFSNCSELAYIFYAGDSNDWAGIVIEDNNTAIENATVHYNATGHTKVAKIAIEPTCTQNGLTEGFVCSVCDFVYEGLDIIPALGHTEVVNKAVAPTCTETGLTEGKHCSVCNEVIIVQTVVAATGHTEVIDEAIAPTTTTTGLTEGSHCGVCGEVLVAQQVIEMLKSGWVAEDGGYAYYVEGEKYTGYCQIEGIYYDFGDTGIIADKVPYTGILKQNEQLYYYQNGLMATGWLSVEDKQYYAYEDGHLATGSSTINGEQYLFTATGELIAKEITASGSCGDALTWVLSYDGVLTISGTGDMANYREDMVTVPWLDYKTAIKKVIVENGVTSIGDYAFEGCISLAEITLPEGITAIGDYAFKNCDALVDITIPEGVTRLGDHAFADADGLKELILPASVSNIGANVFYDCAHLETVTFKGNLNAISNLAFSWCSNLKKVSIAGTITDIGERAFWYCTSLEELSAKSITNGIGYGAFEGCSELQKINASLDGLIAINGNAFADCINLTEIILPNTLIRINDYAFKHCGLEEIIIPESVTRIEGRAFESCYKLKNVVLSSNATDYTEMGIGSGLFFDCPNLKTVTITNDKIKVIGGNAFGKCSGLTDIYFAGSPNQWNSITVEAGNEALTSDKLTVHCQASDEEILLQGTYTVKEPVNWTLTRGGILTFSGAGPALLSTVAPPEYLVKSIIVEEGITTIESYEAYDFVHMDTLYVADSVTSIDYGIFDNCTSLKDVYYAGSPTQWECLAPEIADSVMIHCEASDDEILASGNWGTNGTWQLTRGGVLDISGSNETIDGSQDWDSYAEFITTVRIHVGVTGINETLNNCVHLTDVYIPDSVVYIYSSFDGFYGCPITDVYYAGSPEEWSQVDCNSSTILNATIHYGRENAPVQQLEPAFSAFVAIDGDQKTKVNLPVEFVLEAFDTEGSYMEKGTDILVWAETSGGVVTSAMTVKRDGINVSKSNQFANVYLLTDAMHDEVFEISFSRTGAYTVYAGILTENRPAFEEIQKLSCDGYSEIKVTADATEETIEAIAMHRLYNPNSGEHFYTGSIEERDMLVSVGWQYEGVAWNAPTQTGAPVYRLYNPNSGDHHYTMSGEERDMLVNVGWQYEGVCWNSAGNDGIPLYRLYNPNADCGSHHYTGSEEERDMLVSVGWIYEGIGWFGLAQ